jgi:hypothetical protein
VTSTVKDPEATLATLVAAFDQLDAQPHTPEVVAKMAALADTIEAVEAMTAGGGRPSPASASARLPKGHRVFGEDTRRDRTVANATAQVLTASGTPFAASEDVAQAMADALNRAAGANISTNAVVASRKTEYPVERQLTMDPTLSTQRIDDVCSFDAITASGGICSPVNVDYSQQALSTDDRPLKDALPAFSATRGGLTYVQQPSLASAAGGSVVWTAANDANPSSPATKPILTLTCGSPTTVNLDAIPLRVQMGNFLDRFAPEQVSTWIALAQADHSRVAELNLLTKISANSTPVSSAQLLGASRDLLATLDQAVAAYRYRTRVPRTVQIRVVLPDWARDMLRADLTRELAHDGDSLAVTDAQIDGWFTVRNISPIWMVDAAPVNNTGLHYVSQQFTAQSSGAVLQGWPTQVVVTIFAEGTFQYLDGGTLSVGVVRDSTLNATNQMEMFFEAFESIAYRGFESLQLVANVRPNGASAATKDTSSY